MDNCYRLLHVAASDYPPSAIRYPLLSHLMSNKPGNRSRDARLAGSRAGGGLPGVPRRLDAKDVKIIEIVQTNGRIAKKALAEAIGLSLTPCFERLRRLERDGFISSYRGVVDPRRFGSFVWVYTEVSLVRHRATDFPRFEAAVRDVPEILTCDALGGGIDYMLHLVARDVAHYQQLMDTLLARDVGVDTYFTYIVTKRVKDSPGLPVAALMCS
jgi:Lrp/AsnC family transcriptional regulator of ectoine degradation